MYVKRTNLPKIKGQVFSKNHRIKSTKTVPDQSLSMREILAKHTLGQEVRINTGQYDNTLTLDDVVPNYRTMDKQEKLIMSKQLAEDIRVNKAYLRDKLKAEEKQRFFAEFQKLQAEEAAKNGEATTQANVVS